MKNLEMFICHERLPAPLRDGVDVWLTYVLLFDTSVIVVYVSRCVLGISPCVGHAPLRLPPSPLIRLKRIYNF
jgi:hypothetical protein